MKGIRSPVNPSQLSSVFDSLPSYCLTPNPKPQPKYPLSPARPLWCCRSLPTTARPFIVEPLCASWVLSIFMSWIWHHYYRAVLYIQVGYLIWLEKSFPFSFPIQDSFSRKEKVASPQGGSHVLEKKILISANFQNPRNYRNAMLDRPEGTSESPPLCVRKRRSRKFQLFIRLETPSPPPPASYMWQPAWKPGALGLQFTVLLSTPS